VDDHIHVFEQTSPCHVNLAGTAFFSRGAVETQCAGGTTGLERLGNGDSGAGATRAKQVVAASVPTDTPLQWRAYGGGCLAEAGQGIELAEHADGAAAVALFELGDEGCGDAGHAGRDGEPGVSQYFLQQR